MDPSYNNSFGSFGANSGTPGGASGAGTSGAGASNGASGNMSANATQGPIVSGGDTTVENFTSSEFPSGGLSIGGERKSRKGVIILLVVLVVLLIGGIAGYMAWKNGLFGGNGESSDSSSNEFVVDENVSMEVAFNRYVNYIVSGEVKDDAVKSEVFDGTIELDRKYEDEEFVKNASALYEVFYGKANDSVIDDKPMIAEVEFVKDGWEYLSLNSNEKVNEEEIIDLYLKNGRDGVNQYISSLSAIDDSEDGNDYLIKMKGLRDSYFSSLIVFLDKLESDGCFVNDEINDKCAMSTYLDLTNEIVSRYNSAKKEYFNHVHGIVNIIHDYSFNIFVLLSGGGNS